MKPPAHQVQGCQGLGGMASTSLGSLRARDQIWCHSLVSESQFILPSLTPTTPHAHPHTTPLPSTVPPLSIARFSGRAR